MIDIWTFDNDELFDLVVYDKKQETCYLFDVNVKSKI